MMKKKKETTFFALPAPPRTLIQTVYTNYIGARDIEIDRYDIHVGLASTPSVSYHNIFFLVLSIFI